MRTSGFTHPSSAFSSRHTGRLRKPDSPSLNPIYSPLPASFGPLMRTLEPQPDASKPSSSSGHRLQEHWCIIVYAGAEEQETKVHCVSCRSRGAGCRDKGPVDRLRPSSLVRACSQHTALLAQPSINRICLTSTFGRACMWQFDAMALSPHNE